MLTLSHPADRAQTSPVRLGALPARSFVITRAEELLEGPEADGQLGDLRLDNGRVAFIIDGPNTALGFAESGGNLIDAAPLGGKDVLKQLFGYLDDTFPRQPVYTSVEPGRRGDVAIVTARGHDAMDARLHIETEYALRPGALALEITTTVTNHGDAPISAYEIGDAIQWGRAERFAPEHGYALHGLRELRPGWIAALGDGLSYAYVVQSGPLKGRHGSAWSDLNVVTAELPPGGVAQAKRWFVVDPTGGSEAQAVIAELRGEVRARLRGRVREEGSGAAVADVRVLVEDASGRAVDVARSTAAGYDLRVPPGTYQLRVEGAGRRALRKPVSVQAPETQVDLLVSRPSRLAFEITEDGAPVPAKLTVLAPDGRAPRLGPSFTQPGGNVALTATGRGEIPLAPGPWRLVASRGPEYTIAVRDVEVPPGETLSARFDLTRAIDTRGWLCVDPHQHAQPSADSGVSLEDRALSNLAEGLEVMVGTDHNVITDFRAAAARLGATRPLEVIAGSEATLDGLGHFNAYPLTPHPGKPRGGAPDLRGKDAHQIVQALRALDGGAERVVQVNHPRAGIIGYFDTVKLDPAAGALPPDWEGGFDAIEVFTTKDASLVDAPMRDWFALLNLGLRYTAVGGSDAHAIFEQEVGYPRTCVPWDQKARPEEALVQAIRKRHEAIVTSGPFVRVSVGGRGMGQLAAAPRGRVRLDLEVQAAPWVDVRRIEIVVNGERRGKPIAVEPGTGAVRYKGTVDLRIAQDSWLVVIARGENSLEPVVARREPRPPPLPLALTNPIYLDRDGDGKFTAPSRNLR